MSRFYIVHVVRCPACGGDLPLRLPVGFIESLERQGISEKEQFDAIVRGLASHRITCRQCQVGRAN